MLISDHATQALQFLALEHKGELSLDDISCELCPSLDAQQLYRLCTTAWGAGALRPVNAACCV